MAKQITKIPIASIILDENIYPRRGSIPGVSAYSLKISETASNLSLLKWSLTPASLCFSEPICLDLLYIEHLFIHFASPLIYIT